MKYIKLFESFVNEEFTQGLNLVQTYLLNDVKDNKEEKKKVEKLIKDRLREFGVEVGSVYGSGTGYHSSFGVSFYLPEGFFSKVKRFFGFSKSIVRITYTVRGIGDLPYDKGPGSDFTEASKQLREEIEISIGYDRTNEPYGKALPSGGYGTDPDSIDMKIKSFTEEIKIDKNDLIEISSAIREINPETKYFNNPDLLLNELNKGLSKKYDYHRKLSEKDPNYKFVVLNTLVF